MCTHIQEKVPNQAHIMIRMIAWFVGLIVHKKFWATVVCKIETHFWGVAPVSNCTWQLEISYNRRKCKCAFQRFFRQYSHLTTFVSPLNRLTLKLADILSRNIIKFTLAFSRSVWKTDHWVWNTLMLAVEFTTALNCTEFTRIYRIMKVLNRLI